jgi:sulfite reductase (ferredoxin)
MRDFQKHYVDTGDFTFEGSFPDFVLRINKDEPTESFANQFLKDSLKFLQDVQVFRSAKKEAVVAK